MSKNDLFNAKASLTSSQGSFSYYRLAALEEAGLTKLAKLPFSIRIMLESLLRNFDGFAVREQDIVALAQWSASNPNPVEIPFKPARVLLQDFTGVPAVVDLAALRAAMQRLGGDPKKINPLVPVDLVIDHSVQVDAFGSKFAIFFNAEREFERNRERYEFLRWGQKAFNAFRVVPPASGIVHQVNLEYLADVVTSRNIDGETVLFPDSLVGTDSHTTMVNGLGVVGWGVGGIEAEAVMLGQPIYMLSPEVVGFQLEGSLPEGATATDLVLTITQMLRKKGVVGKFVEFYGSGISKLSLPDRATIANMAPEYGATVGFFPVDEETLAYLRLTGRPAEVIERVERYCKAQGLFHSADTPHPEFSDTLYLDMSTIEPSVAGPRRPQDRVALSEVKRSFWQSMQSIKPDLQPNPELSEATLNWLKGEQVEDCEVLAQRNYRQELFGQQVPITINGESSTLSHGSVAIAAITSCTNTSNPAVMLAAGLIAKNAVERGLRVKAHVKTSLAPGSRVVTRYLEAAGLTPYLEALRFHTVGYGCTTCIGNSGPLPEPVAQAVQENDLVVAAVLSGNRNFEGRVNPLVRANYLASPPLVIAYALAGTVDIDFKREPIGYDPVGNPVYLSDIWPSQEQIKASIDNSLKAEMFQSEYAHIFDGDQQWQAIKVPEGDLYQWNSSSTYIQEPPFFRQISREPEALKPIVQARALALLGDSITTDHISPAGSIAKTSPAAEYLRAHGVEPSEFNSYGSRRGNHEVMMRGTFANIRLRNQLLPGSEGGVTRYLPTNEQMSIYDAAMRYQQDGTPLIVFAGAEYGTGSSRDWAAKGTYLLGVRAVVAQSFERIHRSNLVGMGVLPIQFKAGDSWQSLGITGEEFWNIEGLGNDLQPGQTVTLVGTAPNGKRISFEAILRIDTPVEVEYYRNGGILNTVLRQLLQDA